MANDYYKRSRLSNKCFELILEMFIEGKTVVKMRENLDGLIDVQLSENSLNAIMMQIRNSIGRSFCHSQKSLTEIGNLESRLINELGFDIRPVVKKQYAKFWENMMWIYLDENEVAVRGIWVKNKDVKRFINEAENSRRINENLFLVTYTNGIVENHFYDEYRITKFKEFCDKRLFKYNGLKKMNQRQFFYECVYFFNHRLIKKKYKIVKLKSHFRANKLKGKRSKK